MVNTVSDLNSQEIKPETSRADGDIFSIAAAKMQLSWQSSDLFNVSSIRFSSLIRTSLKFGLQYEHLPHL